MFKSWSPSTLGSALQESIAWLDLTVRVRHIEVSSLQDSLCLDETIKLNLAVCSTQLVIHGEILTVRVDLFHLLQYCIQCTFLGSALVFSFSDSSFLLAFQSFLRADFFGQGFDFSFRILLECIKLSLRIIF